MVLSNTSVNSSLHFDTTVASLRFQHAIPWVKRALPYCVSRSLEAQSVVVLHNTHWYFFFKHSSHTRDVWILTKAHSG